MTQDDSTKHAERIKFWDTFNVCWLALLQRQKDDTEQLLNSGRPPAQSQGLLSQESLEEMGNELVSLCDGLEKHGLVDYQMGVSEQEIIESEPKSSPVYRDRHEDVPANSQAVLTQCIDLNLTGSDDEIDEEAEIDPMLSQPGPGAGR